MSELEEALRRVPWTVASSAPDDPVEIIGEWLERYALDDSAEEAGITREGSTSPAVAYAQCAWAEIKQRNLQNAP